jgi:hypothetical protein
MESRLGNPKFSSWRLMMLAPLLFRFKSLHALSAILATAMFAGMCTPLFGQEPPVPNCGGTPPAAGKPFVSEDATASVTVAGGTIDIHYNTPHMHGRKIMGCLVPYGKVWRTGANPATMLITSVPLKFGDLLVPAGSHTIYTLPGADRWLLIINNQTGQWGLTYDQGKDLGRTPMKAKPMTAPQDVMSISFEKTTANSTELHVRWETADRYVLVSKP